MTEPLLRHVIGGILRTERTEQSRTLRDVADAARVSMPYLSEVERGRKEVSSEILAAVTAALGLRLVDVVVRAQRELARAAGARPLTALPAPKAVPEVTVTHEVTVTPEATVTPLRTDPAPSMIGTGSVTLRAA